MIEQVGAAGQYGFFSFPGFGGYGAIEMVGGVLCFSLHFPQFAVSSLGGWICAVGILCFIFYGICSGFLRFPIFQLLSVGNLLQEVSENSAP
jgi:hypothetical protein